MQGYDLPQAEQYAKRHKRRRVWQKVVGSLACVVVFITTYMLILPAITMEQTTYCGYEEHQHGEGCFEKQLICGYPEEPEVSHVHTAECYEQEQTLICELEETAGHVHDESCIQRSQTSICTDDTEGHEHTEDCFETTEVYICGKAEGENGHTHDDSCYETYDVLICEQSEEDPVHTHTEACYEEVLICEKEEHEHQLACFSDPSADVESEAVWTRNFSDVTLTGDWTKDVLLIAESQIGYQESTRNYIVAEDGRQMGYSRYGDWYGDAYGDWCAMFVSFCLHYAGIPEEVFPQAAGCRTWIRLLEEKELYRSAAEEAPQAGDVIFFDWENDGLADHVGLVYKVEDDGRVTTIEGNSSDRVQSVTYHAEDERILGYGLLPANVVLLDDEWTQQTLQAQIYQDGNYSNQASGNTQIRINGSFPQGVTAKAYPVSDVNFAGQWVVCAYDISLFDSGNHEYQPTESVSVTIQLSDMNLSDALSYRLYHIPESGEPEEVLMTRSGNTISFSTNSFSTFALTADGIMAGDKKLVYNDVRDAFSRDPVYAKYYNANSPIGTAGSFHIVAFNSANLGAHTNGNVLAKNLYAGANFGTNNFANELSYIQNYEQVNGNSASNQDHLLVIGSENTVTLVDNNNAFAVNGTKIDKPKNLVQDTDTLVAPFIDLDRVQAEILQISNNLKNYPNVNLTYTSATELKADHSRLMLETPSGVGVVSYTASELSDKLGGYVQIDGFKTGANGTVVINVDCTGVPEINMPQARVVIDGQLQNTSEVTEFSAGKVIWNFVHASGVTINTHLMTGTIVAPGATVNINQNLNGTVVADIVNVHAESHRTDFTGNVTQPDEQPAENEYYVTVQKIETGYAGTALPGAEFDLYKWENNGWEKTNTESLVTGPNGTVMLRNLEASVAYKLVETKAPDGYVLKGGAFTFWVRTDKNQTQPNSCPSDFSGNIVEVGGVLLAANDKKEVQDVTSLTIQKLWKASDGAELTDIAEDSIQVKVYQIANGNDQNKKLYQELTLSKADNWSTTLDNLPLSVTDDDGNTVTCSYCIQEIPVPNYTTSYENNGGTTSGTITVINTAVDTPGYELPETGGPGTIWYALGGMLLIVSAGILLVYNHSKRRKEDAASS